MRINAQNKATGLFQLWLPWFDNSKRHISKQLKASDFKATQKKKKNYKSTLEALTFWNPVSTGQDHSHCRLCATGSWWMREQTNRSSYHWRVVRFMTGGMAMIALESDRKIWTQNRRLAGFFFSFWTLTETSLQSHTHSSDSKKIIY